MSVRHILSLSGGKDSTALAIYMRDRVPDMEYLFCDTEKELPETYEYLGRLEAFLGRKIVRLMHDGRGFDHHLSIRGGYLPSPRNRWCTELLKLRPFEAYVGKDIVYSYVGIRFDEDRDGYISTKKNIRPVFPFKEDRISKRDVMDLLDASGLGLPEYYRWRSRSGCFFCFFQQKIEWVGLLENHPDLFEQAKAYEGWSPKKGINYTWTQNETLDQLSRPERVAEIRSEHSERLRQAQCRVSNQPLVDVMREYDDYVGGVPCLMCDV